MFVHCSDPLTVSTAEKDIKATEELISTQPQHNSAKEPTSNSVCTLAHASHTAKPTRRARKISLDRVFSMGSYVQGSGDQEKPPAYNHSLFSPHAHALGERYIHANPPLCIEDILTPANIACVKAQAIQRRISQNDAPDQLALERRQSAHDEYEEMIRWRRHSVIGLQTQPLVLYS